MKRQNRFIVALLAAGITFATLTATVGTEHWKRGYFHRHGYYHYHDHPHDHDHDHNNESDKDWNKKNDEGSGT